MAIVSGRTGRKGGEDILIKGAKVHNLKNIDVSIPRNRFVVITGVSGSGKSSLAMDTLYAEGQRRYLESLSSYARQFLTRMEKPDVEYIRGISPAIAIGQRTSSRNTRSTVGTTTEIYDYLRLLFARIGRTYSPKSGKEVKKSDISDVVDFVHRHAEGAKVYLLAPLVSEEGRFGKALSALTQKGFSRLWLNGEVIDISAAEKFAGDAARFRILIDRFIVKKGDEDNKTRIADSVQTAFYEGHGECIVAGGKRPVSFSNRFEMDGMLFNEPTPQFFNFNSPYGACQSCEGFGSIIGIDEDLVIPNKNLSVYDGAVACWRGEKMSKWNRRLISSASIFDFPIHRPWKDLTEPQRRLVWTGNEHFKGLNAFFRRVESKAYKIQYRVMLARYRGRTVCPDCRGSRLRKETGYVRVSGSVITDLLSIPVSALNSFFNGLRLRTHDLKISERLLVEIRTRLKYLEDVGLGYLTLSRVMGSLSGGEAQRIHLTRALGSNLTDSIYILDEPSIGLHSRDTQRLIGVIKGLRDLGNTVVVVEHDEEIMRAADHIIDMGPMAGAYGGEVVFSGKFKAIMNGTDTLTAKYLKGEEIIAVPARRKPVRFIRVEDGRQHNLKNIDVRFPLNAMTAVTGVSGSGKTTLVRHILYPAMKRLTEEAGDKPGDFGGLKGDVTAIKRVEMVDQNPLGKSSRSNPVTYLKAYDAIRDLFARQRLAMMKGFTARHFSFNIDGGRCDTCKGDGEVVVEMQFLADIHLLCEACGGKRFNPDVLGIKCREKNIAEILDMSVDEAMQFFSSEKEIISRIKPLADVGLGYIKLGQSSDTLSGGEAQRVKLASFLTKGASREPVLFIFDEPSTGLHFHDIRKLIGAFNALIENGHTVVVIEHNPDIVKCADWVVDLGPGGGDEGGHLVFEGTPEGLVKEKKSVTGRFLGGKLGER